MWRVVDRAKGIRAPYALGHYLYGRSMQVHATTEHTALSFMEESSYGTSAKPSCHTSVIGLHCARCFRCARAAREGTSADKNPLKVGHISSAPLTAVSRRQCSVLVVLLPFVLLGVGGHSSHSPEEDPPHPPTKTCAKLVWAVSSIPVVDESAAAPQRGSGHASVSPFSLDVLRVDEL